MANKHLVFVYGSLKQGMLRNNALRGQRYIGVAVTEPKYGMFQLSGYPALINEHHAEAGTLLKEPKPVYGELYELDHACVLELDKIEGCDQGLYERRTVELKDLWPMNLPSCQEAFGPFLQKRAEAYFYKKAVGGAKDCGSFWSHR
jgi:gamma-glutamylcyclotransferase (GGCT)/AIG2-like uncharacterized protein YtfP